MDEVIKNLMSLPPIEPSISATEIKRKLYNKVKELNSKAGSIEHPGLCAFMVGGYGMLKDLYEELYGRKVSDQEIRGWKNEFENISSKDRKSS